MRSSVEAREDNLLMLRSQAASVLAHLLELGELVRDVPRQQLLDAVDRMLRDARQNVLEVPLRIDAIELAGLDEAVNDRGPSPSRRTGNFCDYACTFIMQSISMQSIFSSAPRSGSPLPTLFLLRR